MRLFIHILKSVAVMSMLMSGIVMQSCSGMNDSPGMEPGDMSLETVFTLTVSDTSSGSRTPGVPTGGYDRGEAYENYIDIDGMDFRFYFFDEDNRFIAPLEVGQVIPMESTV